MIGEDAAGTPGEASSPAPPMNSHKFPVRPAPFQEWRRSLTPSFPLSRLRERVGEKASLCLVQDIGDREETGHR